MSNKKRGTDARLHGHNDELINPLRLRPGDLNIADTARALSRIHRFAGNCDRCSYTVAEHSWYVSQLVPARYALDGLLHDAHECLISDVPSPIKTLFGASWAGVEGRIAAQVRCLFGGHARSYKAVLVADHVAFVCESCLAFEDVTAFVTCTKDAWLTTEDEWRKYAMYKFPSAWREGFGWTEDEATDRFLTRYIEVGGSR
jgi:hypothetical protein